MTSDRKALSALLVRVEAAEGPDRELDGLIWRHVLFDPHLDAGKSPLDMPGLAYSRPEYTASLDAALALCERVLGDVKVRVTKYRKGGARAEILADGVNHDLSDEQGATPALALIAAMLRVKLAELTSPEPAP